MWLAAATDQAGGDSYTLLNIVFIFAGVVVTVAGGVITALINKSAKTTPSPPPPTASATNDPGAEVRAIVRMLQERADDCDNGRDLLDRQVNWQSFCLELIARHVGLDLPRPPRRD